jgi:Na+-transporting methylmalonyl-CoA/oxaloacetate decarboxylase gamma subunit
MNESGNLLAQGLTITVWGMSLVFLGLALLWGLMALLARVFPANIPAGGDGAEPAPARASQAPVPSATPEAAALTAERARVAAIVAGALLAHALPWQPELPEIAEFEHARSSTSWVTTNRARSLSRWEPPRNPGESGGGQGR